QGKYEEAEPLNARAIEILEKSLGPDHPDVATALNNRAGLLRKWQILGSRPSLSASY
ncbi:unnamed protein product, partial [Ectocarpus sp. 12 AP-2014]